jgi:hypothetical protein
MHGRGLGDDAPLHAFSSGGSVKSWVLEENSVFMVKPVIMTNGRRQSVVLGDSVVCTPAGARRLGSRRLGIIELL